MCAILAPKDVVATHEAGHALVVLATPLRPYILEAQICDARGQWQGRVAIDGPAAIAAKADLHSVFDFAKSIAGPLAQICLHPNSIPIALGDAIKQYGGLLLAARDIKNNNVPGCEVQWWPDLKAWLSFIRSCPNLKGTDFLDTETGILKFLKEPSVDQSLRLLSQKLTNQLHLGKNDLLLHSLVGAPALVLPQKLQFR